MLALQSRFIRPLFDGGLTSLGQVLPLPHKR
jgi:hypothetical protein